MDKSKEILAKFDEILELAGKQKLTPMLEKVFSGVHSTGEMQAIINTVYDEIAASITGGTEKFQAELEKTLSDTEAMKNIVKEAKHEVFK